MEDLQKKCLEKLKKLKGIVDDQSDDVFLFVLESVIYDMLNYCHIEIKEWPEALDHTAVLITVDAFNELHLNLNVAQGDGEVKSLKENDFSISKETKAEVFLKMMQSPSFLRNYTRVLNRYRRLAR